jgi:hypothetical protein
MRCRVCKCTQERACDNGCGWAPGLGDLCTNCAQIVEVIRVYSGLAYRFSWAALKRETITQSQPTTKKASGGSR